MPRLGANLLSRRHHDSVSVTAVAVERSEQSHAIDHRVSAGQMLARVRLDDAVGGIGPYCPSDWLAVINDPQSSGTLFQPNKVINSTPRMSLRSGVAIRLHTFVKS